MKITKLGQSCLVIETQGKKIIIDPGSFSVEAQQKEKNLDLMLITHEHGDHFDLNSVKEIVKNNPNIKIVTNKSIQNILGNEGIQSEVLSGSRNFGGVEVESFNAKHEEIFEDFGQVENTAFLIDQRLFHPGDSFFVPNKPVEILALPTGGPWSRVRDFMKYALEVKPKFCFFMHDSMLVKPSVTAEMIAKTVFPKQGIEIKILTIGEPVEF